MRALLSALVFAITAQAAGAGAWTLEHSDFQVITGMIASRATQRFDGTGNASEKTAFNKLLIQNTMEYGLTDAVTLFVAPQYVQAGMGGVNFKSASFEGGARILLLSRIGMLSLQTSAKSAGAFDMSTSAGGEAGRQIELRLLYGSNFKLFGYDGFFDVQAAERWIRRPRPNEMCIDATLGLWLDHDYMLLLQSFNLISGSGAKPPYEYYRLHKTEVSLVERITPHWFVQTGYFLTPAGQNIVKESGMQTTIVYRM